MPQQSWEAENIDDLLDRKTGAFARTVAFGYLHRLIEAIDPASQTMSAICQFFEDEGNFMTAVRTDFPSKRAAHTRRQAEYNSALRPLKKRQTELTDEQKRLAAEYPKADQYDKTAIQGQLAQLGIDLTELRSQIAAVHKTNPKRYRPFYLKNKKGLYPRARRTDVEYLKTYFERNARRQKSAMPHPVFKNFEALGDLFQWPPLERDAIRLLWVLNNSEDLKKLVNDSLLKGVVDRDAAFNHLAAVILGTDRKTVSQMFSPVGDLAMSGVIIPPTQNDFMPKFSDSLLKMLDEPDVTMERMLQMLVGDPATTHLDLHANFNYVADHIAHARMLVASALKDRMQGQNIIVYGMQDSGKTEFTKALAKSLGVPLFMLAESKAGQAEPTPAERLARVLLAKRMTSHMEGVILAVDEAEDLLRIREGNDRDAVGVTKVYLNRLLERGYMTVWIVNDIEKIHPAVRRRFKYAIPFGALTQRDRLAAWNDITTREGLELPAETVAELAAKYTVPVGSIVTAVENAKATTCDKAAVERSLRATGNFVFGQVPAILSGERANVPYFPELENFKETRRNLDPAALRSMVTEHVGNPVPVLCYGPSGTGKKSFFRDIAQKTGREFLNYNIMQLFQDDGSFLSMVLHDATNKPCIIAWDGMAGLSTLPAHHPAVPFVRSKITQIVDMIPCVQAFCSNTKDKLPSWLVQDFPLVVEFETLKPAQIRTAWQKFFGVDAPSRTGSKHGLTPAHFSAIVHRYRGFRSVGTQQIDGDLTEISSVKPQDQPKQVPPRFRSN